MPWSHNHWVLDTVSIYLVTLKSKWGPLELAKRNESGVLQSQNHSIRWCKTRHPKTYRCADDAKARLSDAVSPGIGIGWQPDVEALHRTDWLSLQPQPPAMLDGKTPSYVFFFWGEEFPNPLSSWWVDQRELVIPGPGILDSWVEVSSLAASGCSCCGQFEAGLGARRETKTRRLDRKEKNRKWKTDQGGVEPPKRAVKANQGFAWSYATPIGQLVLCYFERL